MYKMYDYVVCMQMKEENQFDHWFLKPLSNLLYNDNLSNK